MFRVFADRGERHLMSTEGAFNRDSVHFFRTSPSLGRAQDDHGPDGLLLEPALTRLLLNGSNLGIAIVQRSSQELVDNFRIVAFNKIGLVAASYVQGLQVFIAGPRLNRRSGNLVAVEVQNRKHRAVPRWIEEVDGLPASFERTSLRFSVTDDAGNDQIRIVESGAESVNQRIAKFSALMHGIRNVRSAMAGHAARRRELAEKKPQAVLIRRDLRMYFGISSFQIGARIERRTAMSRTSNVNDICIVLFDQRGSDECK